MKIISFLLSECHDEKAGLVSQMACLQQELLSNRSSVDALSTQMATLARHQKLLKSHQQELKANLQLCSEVMQAIVPKEKWWEKDYLVSTEKKR